LKDEDPAALEIMQIFLYHGCITPVSKEDVQKYKTVDEIDSKLSAQDHKAPSTPKTSTVESLPPSTGQAATPAPPAPSLQMSPHPSQQHKTDNNGTSPMLSGASLVFKPWPVSTHKLADCPRTPDQFDSYEIKDAEHPVANLRMMTVNTLPSLIQWPLEELRLGDYRAGKKYVTNSSSTYATPSNNNQILGRNTSTAALQGASFNNSSAAMNTTGKPASRLNLQSPSSQAQSSGAAPRPSQEVTSTSTIDTTLDPLPPHIEARQLALLKLSVFGLKAGWLELRKAATEAYLTGEIRLKRTIPVAHYDEVYSHPDFVIRLRNFLTARFAKLPSGIPLTPYDIEILKLPHVELKMDILSALRLRTSEAMKNGQQC
jgi:hypothetical protein